MDRRKINWGIIGCANIAKDRFIPALLQTDNSNLYAIAGRSPEKLASFAGAFHPQVTYGSYEELLADPQVDAVYVPLPNTLHMEWSIRAMEAGKHVLCEKPLGMNAAQVSRMIETACAHKVRLAEAFSYLHGGAVQKAHEIIDSGVLGRIKHIDVRYAFDGIRENDIRLNKTAGGGVIYDLGCYCISFIQDIYKEEPVDVHTVFGVGKQSFVDENAMVSMTFPEGKTARFYAAFDSFTDSERTIVGEKGVLSIPIRYHEYGNMSVRLTDAEGRHEIKVLCENHFIDEIREFAVCILTGKETRPTLQASLMNARTLDRVLGYK